MARADLGTRSTADTSPTAGTRPAPASARAPRIFAVLTGVTSLAIFLQAVTAGQFVSQDGRTGWIDAHGGIADACWVLALATAVYGAVALRRAAPRLVAWAGLLFVLTLAQTGVGHLITDGGQDGWIAVHVPLPFAIMGLTVWLSVRATMLRRRLSPAG